MITDLFICLVLCLINSKSNQWILMKFSGNVDNRPITDDYILVVFWILEEL